MTAQAQVVVARPKGFLEEVYGDAVWALKRGHAGLSEFLERWLPEGAWVDPFSVVAAQAEKLPGRVKVKLLLKCGAEAALIINEDRTTELQGPWVLAG